MATHDERGTPLMALLRACKDDAERHAFADLAGTTVNYLYALAGCHRGQPRVGLAFGIEDASREFHRKTKGRKVPVPVVTARELSSMCATTGFSEA
jgi:hypothetical protein